METHSLFKITFAIPFFIAFLHSITNPLFAQEEVFDFQDSTKWRITDPNASFTNYYGKKGLYLPSFNGTTLAYLKDYTFTEGIIEVDAFFLGHGSYNGLAVRMQSEADYEYFYLRPQSSRRMGAVQYAPVYNKSGSWQVYSGITYSPSAEISTQRWVHIKLVVKGDQAEMYLDEKKEPVLRIYEMKRGFSSGKIGLVGLFGGAIFADFKISKTPNPPITEIKKPELGPGVITQWQISEKFGTKKAETFISGNVLKMETKWKNINTDAGGIIDFAKYAEGDTLSKKTIFAKVSVTSDKAQTKLFSLAFTDNATVFLNNKPVFKGAESHNRESMSLFFDINEGIYLNLNKGKNEILVSISDYTRSFGSWGIKAAFEDLDGLKFVAE